MEWKEFIIEVLGPIFGAVGLLGGGATGYFYYKSSKPKTVAEAQKLQAEVVVTFADGWQKLAQALEAKMEAMEKKYEEHIRVMEEKSAANKQRIEQLEELMEERERVYQQTLRDKDSEIAELRQQKDAEIAELRVEIGSLRIELAEYQRSKDQKVEDTKQVIKEVVDSQLDEIKNT